MTITLESLERAARRALEEDDTAPATRRDLSPAPHLFLLDEKLADDAKIRDAQVRVRLDALRDRASGPYVVRGRSVRARPMFRDAARAPGCSNEVKDVVTQTQALLDAGRLPANAGELGALIREMQRDAAIGFDEAEYAREALRVVTGRDAGGDLHAPPATRFANVPLDQARAGDLVVLEEQVVVIYRVESIPAERLERYRARGAALEARPHRVFEIDGSWEAGLDGGFRRDTWLFDERSMTWGSWDGATGRFVTDPEGPAGERFTGVFRLRD